ncbi:diaminopimelate decarboxylase [Rhizobium mongolense subsp. loessense]|uniref:Diaminopimelate decarboxylase n=1 Tax=Rhizobium mongolense subsp. loessense TaxID=158890 RepID=A0A1G4U5B2_9HYPH|nr:acyl-CoA dehydrogenase family protein [Rhizobium mongolense]SCW88836.1 diaminopimelate decarboxylase [Rhizobium mongolense subsp. loessense]
MFDEDKRLWAIADTVGTPFYVFDAAIIREQYFKLKTAFPSVDFFYSLKANPNLSIVRELVTAGMGCEVCSFLEFETAAAAGVGSDRMLFVGPAKSDRELERCVVAGIKAIVVESLTELERVDRLARDLDRVQNIALRLNPDFHFPGARLSMSGRATQFGIDIAAIDEVLARSCQHGNTRIAGIHVYMGTRILEPTTIANNTRQILMLASEVAAKLGYRLDFVDIGGGFGVPYHEGEEALDLDALRYELEPIISSYEAEYPRTKVCIELGRYMVASAGRFVAGIRQTKVTKGENFAICDGGSNVHSAAAGQGSLLRKNFPISLVKGNDRAPAAGQWTITGPLCTPMDILGKDVLLDRPEAGDLICIHQSGAYGATASPVNFLGFGQPAEVMVDGETITLVRERASIANLLNEQRPRSISGASRSREIKTSCNSSSTSVFQHPCLERLDDLKDLLIATGHKLERDTEAWRDLWADPIMRAFTLVGVPERYNGFSLGDTSLGIEDCGYSLHIAMIERLARFDASCILALQGPSLAGGAILKMGTEAQIEQFFSRYRTGSQGTFFAVTEPEAGSDPSLGISAVSATTGTPRLTARKMLVGNAQRAAIGLVFAKAAETNRPILVLIEPDRHASNVKIEHLQTFGLCGAMLCSITIDELPIDDNMILGGGNPSLRDGFLAINEVFERNRPIVAALALGTARGILDHLRATSKVAAHAIADLELTHAALLRRLEIVLAAYETGRPKAHEISLIKLQAVQFADRVIQRAFSLPSSAEFMMDPTLRKKTRDAKAFEYMEGASNIHAQNAFRSYVARMPQ